MKGLNSNGANLAQGRTKSQVKYTKISRPLLIPPPGTTLTRIIVGRCFLVREGKYQFWFHQAWEHFGLQVYRREELNLSNRGDYNRLHLSTCTKITAVNLAFQSGLYEMSDQWC